MKLMCVLMLAGWAAAQGEDCQKPDNRCVAVLFNKETAAPLATADKSSSVRQVAGTKPKMPLKPQSTKPAPVEPENLEPPRARTVAMTDHDIIEIKCARRYETWIIVPPNEHIVEAGTGDAERWPVQVADPKKPTTSIHVKATIPNSRTNLNIRTDVGHTYTFALQECGTACTPDMKVFIESNAAAEKPLMPPSPEEVSLNRTVEDQKKQIATLQEQLAATSSNLTQTQKASATREEKAISSFRSKYPLALACNYRFKANQEPFNLQQVCHDDRFTYVKVGGDPPALYGEQDGELSLVPTDFERNANGHGGTLVVSAVLRRGQLAFGSKKKLEFAEVAK